MQIDIQALDFTLTDRLRAHVEQRLRFALTRLQDRMRRVSVRLSDVNGPKGGVDKRCLVRIKTNGLPDIIVEDTEANLYVAVNRAVDRARRTLERRQWRARSLELNASFQRSGDD